MLALLQLNVYYCAVKKLCILTPLKCCRNLNYYFINVCTFESEMTVSNCRATCCRVCRPKGSSTCQIRAAYANDRALCRQEMVMHQVSTDEQSSARVVHASKSNHCLCSCYDA